MVRVTLFFHGPPRRHIPTVWIPAPKKTTRSRCAHCGAWFRPEPRSAGRQRFCMRPDCRCASKRASREKYREKEESQKSLSRYRGDSCATQLPHDHPIKRIVREYALEDSCEAQVALFVALVARVSQAHLRDSIAIALRRLILEGYAILSSPGAISDCQHTRSVRD